MSSIPNSQDQENLSNFNYSYLNKPMSRFNQSSDDEDLGSLNFLGKYNLNKPSSNPSSFQQASRSQIQNPLHQDSKNFPQKFKSIENQPPHSQMQQQSSLTKPISQQRPSFPSKDFSKTQDLLKADIIKDPFPSSQPTQSRDVPSQSKLASLKDEALSHKKDTAENENDPNSSLTPLQLIHSKPHQTNENPMQSQSSKSFNNMKGLANQNFSSNQPSSDNQKQILFDPSKLGLLTQLLGNDQFSQVPMEHMTKLLSALMGQNQYEQNPNNEDQQSNNSQQGGFKYSVFPNQRGPQIRGGSQSGDSGMRKPGFGQAGPRGPGGHGGQGGPGGQRGRMGGRGMDKKGSFGMGRKPIQGRERSREENFHGQREGMDGLPPATGKISKPPSQVTGDWICPACDNTNFARRSKCNKCGEEMPDDIKLESNPLYKKGDWLCPACKNLNFAKRESCNRCMGARPPESFKNRTFLIKFRRSKRF